ncbi:hypothetical protein PIB30_030416 [Stylosanthes scabra]|uniref:Uncharacterized protein n=1 Tax=Stylosanthes scabra TaxID=79078 RepID=A0ABU6ZAA5_9FABA|nr:hypothetical protein [Stylosanthes scabra]
MRTFERVCLYYGFRPSFRLFMYIYDILIPQADFGFISFRAHQGRKLFDSFEESIQEFKWHYFKVLPSPGKHAFWLDDEGNPFPWVYWNLEVKDFKIHKLDPLKTAAYSLLDNMAKQNKLDRFKAMTADTSKMPPRSILPTPTMVVASSTPAGSSSQVPPTSVSSDRSKAKKDPPKRERPEIVDVEGEVGVKEDPTADLRLKRRKRQVKDDAIMDRILGADSTWKHEGHPVDLAFPEGFCFREALDVGLISASVRKPLLMMPPEQLLGESHQYACKSLACM